MQRNEVSDTCVCRPALTTVHSRAHRRAQEQGKNNETCSQKTEQLRSTVVRTLCAEVIIRLKSPHSDKAFTFKPRDIARRVHLSLTRSLTPAHCPNRYLSRNDTFCSRISATVYECIRELGPLQTYSLLQRLRLRLRTSRITKT